MEEYINEYILRDTDTSQLNIMYECRCSCGRIFYATSTELYSSSVILCGDCLYEIYKNSTNNIDDDSACWLWAEDIYA